MQCPPWLTTTACALLDGERLHALDRELLQRRSDGAATATLGGCEGNDRRHGLAEEETLRDLAGDRRLCNLRAGLRRPRDGRRLLVAPRDRLGELHRRARLGETGAVALDDLDRRLARSRGDAAAGALAERGRRGDDLVLLDGAETGVDGRGSGLRRARR